jgi:hypothetical protein
LEKEFLEKNNFFFISLYSTLYFRCANRFDENRQLIHFADSRENIKWFQVKKLYNIVTEENFGGKDDLLENGRGYECQKSDHQRVTPLKFF